MTPTAYRFMHACHEFGGWLPAEWQLRRQLFGHNVHLGKAIRDLETDGLIEFAAHTLSDHRRPGWIGDLCEAWERAGVTYPSGWLYAQRLTPKGLALLLDRRAKGYGPAWGKKF